MKTDEPKTIYLKDYQAPAYWVDDVHLSFQLDPNRTLVQSRLKLRRNEELGNAQALELDGKSLELLSVKIDGEPLDEEHYSVSETGLSIPQVPAEFILEIETAIAPAKNTELEGLYLSNDMFCTQCEAEGFRKITYFPDRPDVMAVYTTKIVANKKAYPTLLSNGNKIGEGDLEDGMHWAEWHDPHPKPAYLFALVGGTLGCVEDSFTTRSGREVKLQIFVEPGNGDRCDYAMDSLKRSMKWDEEVFGREYDLDIFMIVAVSHFNMGAMENKGLNIFNSQYVLARPETATDQDYANIEGIIAHEYFHNWTGNRITCRDWFQLCLKEGLTVFRDQEFSADMRSRPVQRIQDVRGLRSRQFQEDASPLAHPVRPASYMEINNFYTSTVYEKGAEVVRMMHTLLGAEGFRKGMDLYFERHDGEAATVDQFVAAMADATGTDLSQFKLWYSQAGTPVLDISDTYDRENQTYDLKIKQSCPATPESSEKAPFQIPITLALFDDKGNEIPLSQAESSELSGDVLDLRENEQTFHFVDVPTRPLPSLLRNFSAPVNTRFSLKEEERAFLMEHDTDPFNRWQAGQTYAEKLILADVEALQKGHPLSQKSAFIQAMRKSILAPELDPFLKAEMLLLPGESDLARISKVIDPENIHNAREGLVKEMALALKDDLLGLYHEYAVNEEFSPSAAQAAKRAIRNRSLGLLAATELPEMIDLAFAHFSSAGNMTDTMAGLAALRDTDSSEREAALAQFYEAWQNDDLVVNKWLSIQATSSRPDTLTQVKALLEHKAFTFSNPNKIRALIGAFAMANPVCFHESSGASYDFFGEMILKIDAKNPQIAARLLGAIENWRRFDDKRQDMLRGELDKILGAEKVSKNLFEIATKLRGE